MGAVHRIWLVAALFSTACASNGADLPSASSATAPSVSAAAEPLMGPDWVEVSEPNAAAPAWPLSTGLAPDVGLESPMPGTTAILDPELPKDWTLSLRADRASIADPVVNHSHDHAHSHSAPIVDESESDPIWRDIAPGAADEGGTGSDRYQLPPASLKDAWTEVSSGRYRVLRPATEEELDGYRVIAPPPEAKDWDEPVRESSRRSIVPSPPHGPRMCACRRPCWAAPPAQV